MTKISKWKDDLLRAKRKVANTARGDYNQYPTMEDAKRKYEQHKKSYNFFKDRAGWESHYDKYEMQHYEEAYSDYVKANRAYKKTLLGFPSRVIDAGKAFVEKFRNP